MKAQVLESLRAFEKDLKTLKRDLSALPVSRVNRIALRDRASELATRWVETLRSPLEHKFALPDELIKETSEEMKHLHRLARPNNLKSSYMRVLGNVLYKFQDRFVLPIQQQSIVVESVFDLNKLVTRLSDADESGYLREAVDCANSGFQRAAIVLGWCATIAHMQRKIESVGFARFNVASARIKALNSGKFKRWNKEFSIATMGELQSVFDSDLIVVLEGLALLDDNEAQRLEVRFQYRNHSAHPGQAPIGDTHVVAFFTDICEIVLSNKRFNYS